MLNKFFLPFKSDIFWLVVILILGFLVRLYKIDSPIADWHSWRQADTAAVARDFYKEGYNPLIPKYEDMIGVSEPLPDSTVPPNPMRYRFVEFPIYNSIIYFAYLLNGGVNETLARLTTVIISLGSIIFIYLLTKRYFNRASALFAAGFFAFLPYSIYFSRVVLPDPLMVLFSLTALYFGDRWIYEGKRWQFIVSAVLGAAALLTKPMAIFLLLPLTYSVIKKKGSLKFNPKKYLLLVFVMLLPLGLWRIWMLKFPEGIPASNWLLNGNGIRFHPAFWRWIVGDRLDREVMTAPGFMLLAFGVFKKCEKKNYFLQVLLLSSILYLIVFATGNVQHDYYQILIIPAIAIFLGRGLAVLLEGLKDFLPRLWMIPISAFIVALMLYLGWTKVGGFYQINNDSIVKAGQEADRILPSNAVVVAPYGGDSSFLYQTNRNGFAIVTLPIPQMIQKFGVTDYISVNRDDQTNWVIRHYRVLEQNKDFVIVDLTHQLPGADFVNDPEPNHQ